MPLDSLATVGLDVDFEAHPTAPLPDLLMFDDSAVSLWKMDDASSLVDELGLNDGTLHNGPTQVAGMLPYVTDHALSFDGTNDYASVSPLSGDLSGSWSLTGLVKFAALPGSKKVLATQGAFRVEIRSDGKLQASVQNHVSGSATRTQVVGTTVLQAGEAYLVKLVHDADLDLVLLYVNGRMEASAAHTVGTEVWGLPLLFGAAHGGTVPVVAATGTAISHGGGDATATWVVPKATGLAVGDLMVVHLYNASGNGLSDQTVTVPSGFNTLLYDKTGATASVLIAYKFADAGDVAASSFTFTFAGAFAAQNTGWGRMMRVTGVDTSQPFANPPYADWGNSVSATTGAKYSQSDDVLVLCLVGMGRSVSFSSSDGTELYDSGGGNTPGTAAAGYSSSISDSSTSKSFTVTSNGSGNAWVAVTLMLKGADAQDYAACELQSWALTSRAFTDDDALERQESRNAGEGTLTNVASDGRQVDTARGRQIELDKFEAATSSTTLNDLDRDYDPMNRNSPHYPIKDLRRIKGSLTVDGTAYPLFEHLIEQWPTRWLTPRQAEVKITAADRFAALALADVSGSLGSALTGAQIDRILDKARFPISKRAIDDGLFTMADWTFPADQKALPAIQELVDSELGAFFMSAAGVATFHDYAHRWSAARSLTAQLVFSDDDDDIAAGAIRFSEPMPSRDALNVVNVWNVQTASGTVATVGDPIGYATGYRRVQTRPTRLASIDDATTQARALLLHTARAGDRFDSITVYPTTVDEWAAVLTLEISDRVTVKANPIPGAGGTPVDVDCFVEGIKVTLTPVLGKVSVQLSPVSPAQFADAVELFRPRAWYRMDEAA